MTKLVMYTAKRALMSHPAYKYGRRARTAYGYARRYGPTAIRAGKRIYRAYRKYKERPWSKKHVGEPVGADTARTHIIQADNLFSTYNTRTLNSRQIVDIPKGTNNDRRNRDIMNCRGFKICCEIRNASVKPLYFNMAVICPKETRADVTTLAPQDFFRSYGADRSQDFGTFLTGMELHCLPINSDKFAVLRHWRYRLTGANSASTAPLGYNAASGRNFANLDRYVKLGRQIRYKNQNDEITSGDVLLVWWCDEMFANGGTAAQVGLLDMTLRIVTYFRNPKN